MAVESIASGTQAATLDQEHELASETDPGVYVLVVDLSALDNGDIVELRIKTTALSGGTAGLAYFATYAHAQAAPLVYSIPVPVDVEITATLKQVAGVERSFPWSLLKL